MRSLSLLTMVFTLASTAAWARVSECQTECEAVYKYCTSAGKMTERSCRMQYEKCRKDCQKKEGDGN
jgi:hypothetical protein